VAVSDDAPQKFREIADAIGRLFAEYPAVRFWTYVIPEAFEGRNDGRASF
jgi:plasmid stabilization system protein ParE